MQYDVIGYLFLKEDWFGLVYVNQLNIDFVVLYIDVFLLK